MIIGLLVTAAVTAAFPQFDRVHDALEDALDDGRARGVVVGLYHEGEIEYHALGAVDGYSDAAPDSATLFEIGSITKVFTVLLAESAVAGGKLDWDDTLAGRMRGVEFSADNVGDITLAELAAHTSGLARVPDNMRSEDLMDPYAGYTRQDLDAYIAAQAPKALVKTYAYSNLGMGLLGELTADALGKPLAEAMQARLFRRYGMQDTGFAPVDEERMAAGFSDGADMPRWGGFDALAGAGAIVSSTRDLMRFVEANLKGSDPLLEKLIARAGDAEVAFGWHKALSVDGHTIYWHNGGTGGFRSYLGLDPATSRGVVLLATSTDSAMATGLGMALLTGRLDRQTAEALARYEGSYQLAPGLVLRVYQQSGRLLARATGQPSFELSKSGEDEFTGPGIRVRFELPEEGPAGSIRFEQAGQTMLADRVADELGPMFYKEIDIDSELLDDYVGVYTLAPGVEFTIFRRDAQLFAHLTGQAAHPVFPYAKDQFFYKEVDAQLHFERNDASEVEAVVLHQGGRQRAPKQ